MIEANPPQESHANNDYGREKSATPIRKRPMSLCCSCHSHRSLKLFLIFCACCIVYVTSFGHIDNTCTNKNNNFKLLWSQCVNTWCLAKNNNTYWHLGTECKHPQSKLKVYQLIITKIHLIILFLLTMRILIRNPSKFSLLLLHICR